MDKSKVEEILKKHAEKQWKKLTKESIERMQKGKIELEEWAKEREKEYKKDFYCSLCEHYKTMKAPKEFPTKKIAYCEYDITCKNFKLKSK